MWAGLLRTQAAQAPAGVEGRAAEEPRELLGTHAVQQAGGEGARRGQAGIEQMGGGTPQVRYRPPVGGEGGRRAAAAAVLDPEVVAEAAPEVRRPVPPLAGSGAAVGLQQVGTEQGRPVGMGLDLAAVRPAGVGVGEIAVLADRRAQPGQAPLRGGEQRLQLLAGQAPPPRLGEHRREQERRFDARAARGQMGSGVPQGTGDAAPVGAGELGAGDGAQRPRGEPHAEGQRHPCRPQGLGGGEMAAAPGDAGGEVDVARDLPVAHEEGAQIVEGGGEQGGGPGVVTLRLGVAPGSTATGGGAGDGERPAGCVRPDAELDAPRAAGGQPYLPAQQSRRGQGVVGSRVGRHHRVQAGGRPAQAGGVHGGGELGGRGARGDGAQLGEVGPEGDLDPEPGLAGGSAAQRDALDALGVAEPLHGDGRVGSLVGGGAHRADETGPARVRQPPLEGHRFDAVHSDHATRQQAPPVPVENRRGPGR
ncbi:hypothetical protein GCM10020221_33950 [Streptomyces thioluteus]|uniref:Uncharacterized protein n=1 Tax=Streptomyces thioluteus TaxID=66431 RepID=A0ABN3X4Q6_STRTU